VTNGREDALRSSPESEQSPELCAHCGDAIDTSEWHPVVARSEPDEFRIYPFCDERCRDEWEDA